MRPLSLAVALACAIAVPLTATAAEALKVPFEYMLGTFVLRNSDRSGIIAQLEFINFHGLPADYLNTCVGKVRAVTPAQVRQMTQKYIDDTKTAIVAVGDRKLIEEQVKPYGPLGSATR